MYALAPSTSRSSSSFCARGLRASTSSSCPPAVRRGRVVIVRASDEDAALEERLERLRQAKGATPYGKGEKAKAKAEVSGGSSETWVPTEKVRNEMKGMPKYDFSHQTAYYEGPPTAATSPSTSHSHSAAGALTEKPKYDFSDETVFYEGPPHRGDLAINLALGTTLLWLPLTMAAIGRGAFVNYKFTDKRFSVVTSAPWQKDESVVAYQEIKDVRTVGRGIGLWGDMVVELTDGSKVELRALDRFQEIKKYVLERRDALAPAGRTASEMAVPNAMKGKIVTAEELMGEPMKTGKKAGF